jgi:putative PIN family toxin of toxin-antitoxin system
LRSEHSPHRPRVILDVNIYLSYLLDSANANRTITQLMHHLYVGSFRLVIPEELAEELILVTRLKPYFRDRLLEQDVRDTMKNLQMYADAPDRLADVPHVVRDPKDDYLLAYAILARVDFLVTGDRDLLALDGEIERLRIITAAAFLQFLEPDAVEP